MEKTTTGTGRREFDAAAQQTAGELELVVVKKQPFNAEAPLGILSELITPTPLFYVRSNFPFPEDDAARSVTVDGAVERPFLLTPEMLREMPSRTVETTMECAGNDRIGYEPPAEGEPWGLGAVSSGRWRGVPLREVLQRAGLRDGVVEILFEGADGGPRPGWPEGIPFGRSLPLEKALHEDTLLVYEMNGEPLPRAHGGPLRLIVPGWYGMASVKWLARIAALETPFSGHFQAERYIMLRPEDVAATPLREIAVKALITGLPQGEAVQAGPLLISGAAWSGKAPVSLVEIKADDGDWQPATLLGEEQPYLWRRWEWTWQATPGHHTLQIRASDRAGNSQPPLADWNHLGYVNNAIQHIAIEVS